MRRSFRVFPKAEIRTLRHSYRTDLSKAGAGVVPAASTYRFAQSRCRSGVSREHLQICPKWGGVAASVATLKFYR